MGAQDKDMGLLTYEEAAALVGVHVSSIKRAIGLEYLEPVPVPGTGRKFLRRADVEAYKAGGRRRGPRAARRAVVAATSAAPSSLPVEPDTVSALALAGAAPMLRAWQSMLPSLAEIGVTAIASSFAAAGVPVGPKA